MVMNRKNKFEDPLVRLVSVAERDVLVGLILALAGGKTLIMPWLP
jgi:hypothetical protein